MGVLQTDKIFNQAPLASSLCKSYQVHVMLSRENEIVRKYFCQRPVSTFVIYSKFDWLHEISSQDEEAQVFVFQMYS